MRNFQNKSTLPNRTINSNLVARATLEDETNEVTQTQGSIYRAYTAPLGATAPLIVTEEKRKEEEMFIGIQKAIGRASPVLNEASGKEILIVLGNTRSGKSTLVNYLIGNKLTSTVDKALQVYVTLKDGSGPEIGHAAQSATSLPSKYKEKTKGLDLWDTPGFEDSRGPEVDIQNAFYIRELLVKAKTVKIILVADYNDLHGHNIQHFCKFLNKIITIFPDIKNIAGAISVVFTKVMPNIFTGAAGQKTTVTDVIVSNLQQKILAENTNTSGWYTPPANLDKAKFLVRELINNKNKIGVFKAVDRKIDTLSKDDLDYPLNKDDLAYSILNSIYASSPAKDLNNLHIGLSIESISVLSKCYVNIANIEDLKIDLTTIEGVYIQKINKILDQIDYENDFARLSNIKQKDIDEGIKPRLNAVNDASRDETKSIFEVLLEFAAIDLKLKTKIVQHDLSTKQKLIDFIEFVIHSTGQTTPHKDIFKKTIKVFLLEKVGHIKAKLDILEVKFKYVSGIIKKEQCEKELAKIDAQEKNVQKELDKIKKGLEEVNKAVKDTNVAKAVGLGVAATPLTVAIAPFIALAGACTGAKESISECDSLLGKVAIGGAFAVLGILGGAVLPVVALVGTAPAFGTMKKDEKKELESQKNVLVEQQKEKEEESKRNTQKQEQLKKELEEAKEKEHLFSKEPINDDLNHPKSLSIKKKQDEVLNLPTNKNTKAIYDLKEALSALNKMLEKVNNDRGLTLEEKSQIKADIKSLKESIEIINKKVSNQNPIVEEVVKKVAQLQSDEKLDKKKLHTISIEIKAIEKRLEEHEETITELKNKFDPLVTKVEQITANIELHGKFKENMNKAVESLKNNVARLKDTVSLQEPQLKSIITQLTKLSQKHNINAIYIDDINSQLEAIINNKNSNRNEVHTHYLNEIIYDKEILNHPSLMKEAVKVYGLNRVLDISPRLSNELMSTAIMHQEPEVILAGIMSLDSSYDL